jgi:hypothetical protein
VHILLTEDESGLLQSTNVEHVYRRFGHLLYRSSAFLIEGRVEQDPRRGFSFVVGRTQDLDEALGGAARAETSSSRAPRERKTSASRSRAG